MELTLSEKVENAELKRTDIKAKVVFQGVTPMRWKVKEAIAKELKAKPELTIVKSIDTGFGHQSATVEASVYSDQKTMEAIEPKWMIEKQAKKQEAKPQTADKPDKEAAPAESKAEGNKESPAGDSKEKPEKEEKKEE
ncbi:hypothetical protein JW868_03955 [Candidatus Woesearchaeota archaeon]|nr:hypothetical protein [Candidatus Woesearchaeota archaeon]